MFTVNIRCSGDFSNNKLVVVLKSPLSRTVLTRCEWATLLSELLSSKHCDDWQVDCAHPVSIDTCMCAYLIGAEPGEHDANVGGGHPVLQHW